MNRWVRLDERRRAEAVFLFVILPVAGVVMLVVGAIGALRARAGR